MNIRSLAFALLLLLPSPANAVAAPADVDTLAFLGQRLSLAPNGDAVLVETIVLAAAGPGRALLPFGCEHADSFTVTGRDVAFAGVGGAPAPLQLVARRQLLVLDLGPAAAAGDTVVVRCHARKVVDWTGARGQFGAYAVTRTFINDSDVNLGVLKLVLDVPPGFQVRRISSTEPAFKPEASPVPPYAVGRAGARGFASVTAKHVRPGGRVRIAIDAERVARAAVPLAAGILLVLLYLWFFRDLVTARRAPTGAAPSSTGSR